MRGGHEAPISRAAETGNHYQTKAAFFVISIPPGPEYLYHFAGFFRGIPVHF
jgi:hypothetical protein